MIKVDWHAIIETQLEMLSSEEQQLEYESKCPNVDITSELVAGWFDDSYHPQEATFIEQFDPSEMSALTQFNDTFAILLSRLPSSQGTIRIWLASPVWREVMESAKSAFLILAK